MNKNMFLFLASISLLLGVFSYYQSYTHGALPAQVSATPIAATPLLPAVTPVSNAGAGLVAVPISEPVLKGPTSLSVETNWLQIKASSVGGCLEQVYLKNYSQELQGAKGKELFNRYQSCKAYGLRVDGQDLREVSAFLQQELPQQLKVVHQHQNLLISKEFEFKPDSYYGTIKITVKNNLGVQVKPEVSVELGASSDTKSKGSFLTAERPLEHKVAVFSNGKVEKTLLPFAEKPVAETLLQLGSIQPFWIALGDMYFMHALLPKNKSDTFDFSVLQTGYLLKKNRDAVPDQTVFDAWLTLKPVLPAGGSYTYEFDSYFGPKARNHLVNFKAQEFTKAIDYGFFEILAWPLFFLLQLIQKFVINWGVAIIVLTTLVKIVLFPLALKSFLASKRMQKMQPKINEIREKYANDKQKLNQEMMSIMMKDGANPLSGCLPILPQIPIFFGLFSVFQQTFELRHAPFAFWIKDLSVMDPYYIIPILIAFLYFIQQKITPMPPGMDPMQEKMMKFMPIVFSLMMLTLPSGLGLYMITNTVLSIAQQKYMMHRYPTHHVQEKAKNEIG